MQLLMALSLARKPLQSKQTHNVQASPVDPGVNNWSDCRFIHPSFLMCANLPAWEAGVEAAPVPAAKQAVRGCVTGHRSTLG